MGKSVAVLGLFAGLLAAVWVCRSPQSFSAVSVQQRIAELQSRAEAAGYHVLPAEPRGFYVGREPVVAPKDRASAEHWEGLIWVEHRGEHVGLGAEYRVWGAVGGIGDRMLLDEFQERCRPGR